MILNISPHETEFEVASLSAATQDHPITPQTALEPSPRGNMSWKGHRINFVVVLAVAVAAA